MFQYLFTAAIIVLLAREAFPTSSTFDPSTNLPDTSTDSETVEFSSVTSNYMTNSIENSTTNSTISPSKPGKTTSNNTQNYSMGSTAVSVHTNTTSPAPPSFQCYQGNCTGPKCYENANISMTLSLVNCPKKECAIKVMENSTSSYTEFDCNTNECICQKKVTNHWKTCCKDSKCNLKPNKCSHSSNLVASIAVLVISCVNLHLLN